MASTPTERFCVNCTHLGPPMGGYTCCAPHLGVNLVTGVRKFANCETERASPIGCGPKGLFFEVKDADS